MRHVLSALVQNVPGVLSHISGMLASRGYNIDSLAVGETEDPQLSRMTFVVVGDDRVLDQVRKQLEKIVTVVRVDDIGSAGPRRTRLDADQGFGPAGPPGRDLATDGDFPRPDRRRGPRIDDHRNRRPGRQGRGIYRNDAAHSASSKWPAPAELPWSAARARKILAAHENPDEPEQLHA